MKKILGFISVTFILIVFSYAIYFNTHVILINTPIEIFSLDNGIIEKNNARLTKILNSKRMLKDYKLSSIEYYPKKKLGYVVYSNEMNKNVILVNIKNDIFTTAVKYDNFTKESKRLFNYPIDNNLVKIHSSDLSNIIKKTDSDFNASNISYISISYNVPQNKVIWDCIYSGDNYVNIEVDANTGEVVRIITN